MLPQAYRILACKECDIPHRFKFIVEKIEIENNNCSEEKMKELIQKLNTIYEKEEDDELSDEIKHCDIVEGKLICEQKKYYFKLVNGIVRAMDPIRMN